MSLILWSYILCLVQNRSAVLGQAQLLITLMGNFACIKFQVGLDVKIQTSINERKEKLSGTLTYLRGGFSP